MFSVRLFIALAGVLLMSDANQPEAVTRQSGLHKNLESQPFLVNASNENERAISILNAYLLPADPAEHEYSSFASNKRSLLLVQKELIALLEGTADDRSGSLLTALGYELFAYFYRGQCMDNSRCDEVSQHLQKATGKIIAAFLKESIDEEMKSKIKDIISGNITENGDINGGVSAQQTKIVAREVHSTLS